MRIALTLAGGAMRAERFCPNQGARNVLVLVVFVDWRLERAPLVESNRGERARARL